MPRRLATILKHAILVAFSAAIVLPLLWVLRVSLTDKLTAYKIPPEIGRLGFENYVEIFTDYDFARWFSNSLIVALGSTIVSLPAGDDDGLCLRARYNTGGSPLRLAVLASQMLPPVILVLPLFLCSPMSGRLSSTSAIIVAHIAVNLPFLAWMLVAFFEGESRALEEAARVDGATALPGLHPDHAASCSAGRPRRGPARLYPELERIPLRADPGQLVEDAAGRPREPRDACRRQHRAACRGHTSGSRAGARATAVSAQISDQGALPRSSQVSSPAGG